MKHKTFLSLLFALSVLLSLCLVAFAEENEYAEHKIPEYGASISIPKNFISFLRSEVINKDEKDLDVMGASALKYFKENEICSLISLPPNYSYQLNFGFMESEENLDIDSLTPEMLKDMNLEDIFISKKDTFEINDPYIHTIKNTKYIVFESISKSAADPHVVIYVTGYSNLLFLVTAPYFSEDQLPEIKASIVDIINHSSFEGVSTLTSSSNVVSAATTSEIPVEVYALVFLIVYIIISVIILTRRHFSKTVLWVISTPTIVLIEAFLSSVLIGESINTSPEAASQETLISGAVFFVIMLIVYFTNKTINRSKFPNPPDKNNPQTENPPSFQESALETASQEESSHILAEELIQETPVNEASEPLQDNPTSPMNIKTSYTVDEPVYTPHYDNETRKIDLKYEALKYLTVNNYSSIYNPASFRYIALAMSNVLYDELPENFVKDLFDALCELKNDGYIKFYEDNENEFEAFLTSEKALKRYKRKRPSILTSLMFTIQVLAAIAGLTAFYCQHTNYISITCSAIILLLGVIQLFVGKQSLFFTILSFGVIGYIVSLFAKTTPISEVPFFICLGLVTSTLLAVISLIRENIKINYRH